jgi:hypothetical protein
MCQKFAESSTNGDREHDLPHVFGTLHGRAYLWVAARARGWREERLRADLVNSWNGGSSQSMRRRGIGERWKLRRLPSA